MLHPDVAFSVEQAFGHAHYKVKSQKWIISIKFLGFVRAYFENPRAFFYADNVATLMSN